MSERKLNLLLIEDNDDDVFALTRTLRKSNADVALHVATDGQQAIDYLSGCGAFSDRSLFPIPTLVFLDLKLPYIGGLEVLSWIRGHNYLQDLPVVVLTGSDEARDHEATAALGAISHLVKPATTEQVAMLIQRFSNLSDPKEEPTSAYRS